MIFPADPESIGRLYTAWALRAGQPDASDNDIAAFAAIKAAIRLGVDESGRFHRAVDQAVFEHFPGRDRATVRRAWGMIHRMALNRSGRFYRKSATSPPSPRQRK